MCGAYSGPESQSRPQPGGGFFSYQRPLNVGTAKKEQAALPDGMLAYSGFPVTVGSPWFLRGTLCRTVLSSIKGYGCVAGDGKDVSAAMLEAGMAEHFNK